MSYEPIIQGNSAVLLLELLPFIIWLFLLAAAATVYALRSFGLYQMAKNTAMPKPWLAFVPFAHEYLAAEMADRANAALGKETKFSTWVLISSVVLLASAGFLIIQAVLVVFGAKLQDDKSMEIITILPKLLVLFYYILFMLSSLAENVLQVIAHYYLYRDFEPENAVPYTVLTVFGLDVICKLLIKNRVPVSIAGRYPLHQPKYNL